MKHKHPNYLILDGKNLADFDTYIASSNFMDGAKPDVASFKVVGRSGELTYNYGSFANMTIEVELYIKEHVLKNMPALRNYLSTLKGYVKYQETDLPNMFRKVRVINNFKADIYDHISGKVTLQFDAMPQLFLEEGATPITLWNGTHGLYNPTDQEAKPLIKVYSSGLIRVNDVSINVSVPYDREYIVIDSELMQVYDSSNNNCRERVSFRFQDGYPVLQGGTNLIEVETGHIEIETRYFVL